MLKVVLIVLGSLFLALGTVGVVVPGLPTTPFLLLSAACYVRSSERLYAWLTGHRLFGVFIRNYRESRTIPMRAKIIALTMMVTMVSLSVLLWLDALAWKIVVAGFGATGVVVVLLIPSHRKPPPGPTTSIP